MVHGKYMTKKIEKCDLLKGAYIFLLSILYCDMTYYGRRYKNRCELCFAMCDTIMCKKCALRSHPEYDKLFNEEIREMMRDSRCVWCNYRECQCNYDDCDEDGRRYSFLDLYEPFVESNRRARSVKVIAKIAEQKAREVEKHCKKKYGGSQRGEVARVRKARWTCRKDRASKKLRSKRNALQLEICSGIQENCEV